MVHMLRLFPIILLMLWAGQSIAGEYIRLGTELSQKEQELDQGQNSKRSGELITENELSPLYAEIISFFGQNAGGTQGVGETLANSILKYRQDFNLGSQNFAGLTWQKPFGYFSLNANREIVPDLTHPTNFVVMDKLEISIDAQTYLAKLADSGLIDVAGDVLGLFAGISFKRVYYYTHEAPSYEAGLKSDFNKLFLPFLLLKINASQELMRIEPGEIIRKEDLLSIKAGAAATIPIGNTPLTLEAGFMVNFGRVAGLEIEGVEQEGVEKIHIEKSQERSLATGVHLSLQIEFLKVLRLHLLSYDMSYELTKKEKHHYLLTEGELAAIEQNDNQRKELRKVLRLISHKTNYLLPYLISEEEAVQSNFNSAKKLLHWGKAKKKEVETVEVTKNGQTKTFLVYNEYDQYIRHNFLSYLLGDVLSNLLDLSFSKKIQVQKDRITTVEYEAAQSTGNSREPASIKDEVESPEKLFLRFEHDLYIDKTHTKGSKHRKELAVDFINTLTTLSKDIRTAVSNKDIRGPLKINTIAEVGESGIRSFISISEDEAFGRWADLCKSYRKSKWEKASKRNKYLKRLQILPSEICVKRIGKAYLSLKSAINSNKLIPVNGLKKLAKTIHKEVKNLSWYPKIFGGENVFIHGTFHGLTKDQEVFQSYFQVGTYQGAGPIMDFAD